MMKNQKILKWIKKNLKVHCKHETTSVGTNFLLDEPEEETVPTTAAAAVVPHPKIPDSINLLGSSLPVSIPARTNPSAPSSRLPPQQKKNSSNLNLSAASSSPNPNANAPVTRAPTTVSMSAVSMANVSNVSSTAPTHQYHALRPHTQAVAPMSTSVSDADPQVSIYSSILLFFFSSSFLPSFSLNRRQVVYYIILVYYLTL
jgi:hypothetical protein